MNKNLRFGTVSPSVLTIAFFACAAVACTTQEAKKPDAGGGGGGSAGRGGSGGGAGGTGGVAATAACGSGPYAPLNGTLCLPVDQMITDFTFDPDAGVTNQARFGTFGTTWSGGISAYSNTPGGTVVADVTQSDWHISGTVGNYSGFNLYFDNVLNAGCNMVDASAFDGITFTIWGTSSMALIMGVGILDDTVTPSWLNSVDGGSATPSPGSCIPTMGNSQYYHPGCGDPSAMITVTGTQASPQTVSLKWADITGGACKLSVLPNQILSFYWQFPWSPTTPAYDVDLHIDNLAFIPKP